MFLRPRLRPNIEPPINNHFFYPSKEYTQEEKYCDCCICINDFVNNEKIIELPCGHLFHPECIINWLGKYSHKCPLCKTFIPCKEQP